jgi:D-lactate dehydrogenase
VRRTHCECANAHSRVVVTSCASHYGCWCRYPELTAASLQHLNAQGCSDGYSTSRTCEMSLSNHSGVHFRGLVYLVDEATEPKRPQAAQA